MLSVWLGRCLKQWDAGCPPIAPTIGAAQPPWGWNYRYFLKLAAVMFTASPSNAALGSSTSSG